MSFTDEDVFLDGRCTVFLSIEQIQAQSKKINFYKQSGFSNAYHT